MHETLCFSTQSPSPNLDDLPLRCDGCETVSCVVDHDGLVCGRIMGGSCSDHGRIGHCKCSVSPVFHACAVDRIPL